MAFEDELLPFGAEGSGWDPPAEFQPPQYAPIPIEPGMQWEPPGDFGLVDDGEPQFADFMEERALPPDDFADFSPQVEERSLPPDDLSQPEAPPEVAVNPYEAAAQAEERKGQLEAAKAAEASKGYYDAASAKAKAEEDAFKDHQAAQLRVQERLQKLNQDIDDAVNTQVDPRRRFANADTGEKLAWFASAAIGGFLNPGGPNSTIASMEREIERDINAQVAGMENRRAMLGQKRTLLQDEIAAGNDAHDAILKHVAATWENAAKQIEAQGMKFDSPIAQQNAARAAALARQEGFKARVQLKQRAEDVEFRNKNFTADERYRSKSLGLQGAGLKLQRDQFEESKRQFNIKEGNDLEIAKLKAAGKGVNDPEILQKFGVSGVKVRLPDGTEVPYVASGSLEGKESGVTQVVAGRNAMQNAIAKALEIRNEYGMEYWSKLPKAQQSQIVRAFASVYGLRQTTKEEQEEAKRAAGDYLGSVRDPSEALQQLSANVDDWAGQQLRAHAMVGSGGDVGDFVFQPYQSKPSSDTGPATKAPLPENSDASLEERFKAEYPRALAEATEMMLPDDPLRRPGEVPYEVEAKAREIAMKRARGK